MPEEIPEHIQHFRLSVYTGFWVIWAVTATVVEFIAIASHHRGGTLSEHLWHLMDHRRVYVWIVCGFVLWLFVHLLSRGRLA